MMQNNPIFIFDYKEELKAVLSNEGTACYYFDDKLEEELNGVYSFSFSIPADHPDSIHVVQGARVLFKGEEDGTNEYQEFEVMETVDIHTMDGIIREVTCEHASNELSYNIITDSRPESTARDALTRAIAGSRWTVGDVADLGTNRTNFYYITSTAAIADIRSVWGGETKYRTIMTDGAITARTVSLYAARGQFRGKRFEWNKDIKEMKRTIDFTNTFTALYGRGGSVQDETAENDSTFSRKIGFENVVWLTSNGDPANKPAGQEWVGDEAAKALYGIRGIQHRFGVLELEDDVVDPTEILRRTWEYLQTVNTPMVQYECSVEDFYRLFGYDHEKAFIGDIVYIIDHEFPQPILIEARVIKKEVPLSFDQSESVITIGNFIPDLHDLQGKITELDKVITDNSGNWSNPIIDENNYPNTTPDPVTGLFISPTYSANNLFWDMTLDTSVRGYNIYASQTSGFVAGPSNRIAYVGKVPSYSHPILMGATWYYRIAAVNYHGVEGPLSAEVSSSATPVPSDAIDIDLDIIGEEVVQEVKEYTDAEIAAVQAELQGKADADAVYTKTQADNLLAAKVNADAVYTKAATDSLLAAKAGLAEVEDMLEDKADAGSVYTKTEVDTALNGKVSTTTYNTLAGTVSNHTTQINQNATNIALKADKTTVDTLAGTVSSQGTAIQQNASAIALKANQVDVNTLTGKVNNVESQLTIQAGEIATKVTQTDIDNAISDLEIGGRNWFMSTKWDRESDQYYISEYVAARPLVEGETYTVQIEVDPAEGATGITLGFSSGFSIIGTMPLTGSGTQVVSMTFTMAYDPDRTPEDGPEYGNAIFFREPYDGGVTGITKIRRMKIESNNIKTDWTPAPEEAEYRLDAAETSITQTATEIALKADKTTVDALSGTVTSQGASITANANAIALKANQTTVNTLTNTVSSQGTRLTAAENAITLKANQTTVDSLAGRVSSAEASITTQAGQIALKANQTTVDTLTGRLNNAETVIMQNSTDINLKADKNGIVSAINISSEGIRIDGAKIQITGTTTITNGVIKDAHIQSVAATKISATNLSVISANLGTITAGDISGAYIYGALIEGAEIKTSDKPDWYDPTYTERLSLSSGMISLEQKNPDGTGYVNTSFHGWGMGIEGDSDFHGLSTPTEYHAFNDSISYGSYGISTYAYDSSTALGRFYIEAERFGVGNGFSPKMELIGEYLRVGDANTTGGGGLDLMSGRLSIFPFNSNFGYVTSGKGQLWFDHSDYGDIMLKVQYRDGSDVVQSGSFSLAVLGSIKALNNGTITSGNWQMNGYNSLNHNNTANTTGGYITSNNSLHLQVNQGNVESRIIIGNDTSTPRFTAAPVYNRTAGTSANVYVASNGIITRITSASKYKIMIEEAQDEFSKVLDLAPKTWFDKFASEKYAEYLELKGKGEIEESANEFGVPEIKKHYGLIAEDLIDVGLNQFVQYSLDGEVEGIDYDRLWVYLIPLVKDQREEIASLKSDIAAIKEAIGMA